MASLSWIGLKGLGRAEALDLLGMTETADDRDPSWIAELPTGWTILLSSDSSFASEARLLRLSETRPALGCQFSETVMCSTTTFYDDSKVVWCVDYDCEVGVPTLTGVPPSDYQPIYDRLLAEQAADNGDDYEVDFIFDLPIDLAQAVTGYRHDQEKFEWGSPDFIAVAPPQAERSGGWLKRLFGRKA